MEEQNMQLALIAKFQKEPTKTQLQSSLNHELVHIWARLMVENEQTYVKARKWEVK